MVSSHTLIKRVLQVFLYNILRIQATTIPSILRSVDSYGDDLTIRDVVGRNLVDDDNDNGHSVSHNVMQAIVVVLVLFLLFLFALFLFRKNRLERLQARALWPYHRNLQVTTPTQSPQTVPPSPHAPPMTEMHITHPSPASPNSTRIKGYYNTQPT